MTPRLFLDIIRGCANYKRIQFTKYLEKENIEQEEPSFGGEDTEGCSFQSNKSSIRLDEYLLYKKYIQLMKGFYDTMLDEKSNPQYMDVNLSREERLYVCIAQTIVAIRHVTNEAYV